MADSLIIEKLRAGCVIPAHPLALMPDNTIDQPRQKALTRYYLAAGAGGLTVTFAGVGLDAGARHGKRHGIGRVCAQANGCGVIGQNGVAHAVAERFHHGADDSPIQILNRAHLELEVALVAGFVGRFDVNVGKIQPLT